MVRRFPGALPLLPAPDARDRALGQRAALHLALYDVAYYVSFTDEAERSAFEFGLDAVADAPPWTVFALPPSQLVDVAAVEPTVWDGASGFSDAALDWYDDVDNLDHWLVASGSDRSVGSTLSMNG